MWDETVFSQTVNQLVLFTYMLGNFQYQSLISSSDFHLKGVQNLGEFPIKLNVNDGTNDLSYLTSEGSGSATVSTDAHYNNSND